MLSSLASDVRLAFRSLALNKTFGVVAVLTMAVAIGANTAIYSVVEGVLIRPLPYPDQERLVTISARMRRELVPVGDLRSPFSHRGYYHFMENNRTFEAFGGYRGGPNNSVITEGVVSEDGTDPYSIQVGLVTAAVLELLEVMPQRGRLPTAEEDLPGGPTVMLISDGFWTDRFGRDPAVVGRTMTVNGVSREIIGVMPPRYDFPTPALDGWFPWQLDPESENFGGHGIGGLARLKPGVTLQQATVDAESLIARFEEAGYGPNWLEGVFDGTADVQRLQDVIVGEARQPLLVVMGTVGFILLIACSNLANLMLVRAEGRARDSAIRLALGAGRGSLVRQALTESLVVSVVGAALGLVLAVLGTRLLVAAAPASIPRLDEVGVRGSVLLFTLALAVGAGLLAGVVPAVRAGSRKSLALLRDGSRGSTAGRERHRARSLLVAVQVALALVLLIGSAIMVRSYTALLDVDPGFDIANRLTFKVRPPSSYESAEERARFYDGLLDRIGEVPGAVVVGATTSLPLTGPRPFNARRVEGVEVPEGAIPPGVTNVRVAPGYFESMGIELIEGRTFTRDDHDLRLGTLVVNQALADRFWDGRALGRTISNGNGWAEIVGVVDNTRWQGLDTEPDPVAYQPLLDSIRGGVGTMYVIVETDVPPLSVIDDVREVIRQYDGNVAIDAVRTMEDVAADSVSRTTFTLSLLSLGAFLALFLGAVGIYGVVLYIVRQRTAEIGVRMALGAPPRTVRAHVLSQGLRMAAAGVAVGLLVAYLAGGFIEPLIYGVKPTDPVSMVGGTVIFLAVAALASFVPAVRASRIPPASALRGE